MWKCRVVKRDAIVTDDREAVDANGNVAVVGNATGNFFELKDSVNLCVFQPKSAN